MEIILNREIILEYLPNFNNKFKLYKKESINIDQLIISLINSILNKEIVINIDSKEYIINDFNNIKITNIIYNILIDKEDVEGFNNLVSLFILEELEKHNILLENDVETRFFNLVDDKTQVYNFVEYRIINIKGTEISTNLISVINKNNIINISFNSDFIEESSVKENEIVDIYISQNTTEHFKIKVSNFYYDELNKCYFISGINV